MLDRRKVDGSAFFHQWLITEHAAVERRDAVKDRRKAERRIGYVYIKELTENYPGRAEVGRVLQERRRQDRRIPFQKN